MTRWNPFEDKVKIGRKVRLLHTNEEAKITDVYHFYQQAYLTFSDGGGSAYKFDKFEVLEEE